MTFAITVIAILDFFYQRYDYEKNLKMSKQEIKEEYKQSEGDSQIKSKIKEKQRRTSCNEKNDARDTKSGCYNHKPNSFCSGGKI